MWASVKPLVGEGALWALAAYGMFYLYDHYGVLPVVVAIVLGYILWTMRDDEPFVRRRVPDMTDRDPRLLVPIMLLLGVLLVMTWFLWGTGEPGEGSPF